MMDEVKVRDEEGVSVLEACQILSRNAHRNTSEWQYVHKHVFKNGRLEETHEYVLSHYEKPDEMFEPMKFLIFEAVAMAKAYVMEGIENALASIHEEEDEED
ncbi:MAG: hypothetical protein CML73_05670 [Rhodobiaceae bacterium]|nr:hypothetical protein [Rhodobiaceae bacterium]